MNTLTAVALVDETLRREARAALRESGIRPGAVLAANPCWSVDPTPPRVTGRGRAFRVEIVVRHRETRERQTLRLGSRDIIGFIQADVTAVTS